MHRGDRVRSHYSYSLLFMTLLLYLAIYVYLSITTKNKELATLTQRPVTLCPSRRDDLSLDGRYLEMSALLIICGRAHDAKCKTSGQRIADIYIHTSTAIF